MIMNACVKANKMVDENICRNCADKNCRHAGEMTTKEQLDMATCYYYIKLDERDIQLIIEALKEKYNSMPDELGYIVLKSNLKNVIEKLKLPF